MSFPVIIIAILILPAGALILGIGFILRHRTAALKEAMARSPELRRLRGQSVWTRLGGLVLGVVVAIVLSALLPLGIGVALAPLAISTALVMSVAVGQRLARRTVGEGGVASLTPRRVADYNPKLASGVVVAVTAGLLGLLAWTSSIASADEMGRTGRALAFECRVLEWGENGQDLSRIVTGQGSPFPGSYYAGPIVVALAVLAVCVGAALWLIALRPRGAAGVRMTELDDVLRRQASESVLAAAGFGVASTLAGVCFTALPRLDTSRTCNLQVWGAAPFLVGVLGLVAGAIALVCVVGLIMPTSGKVDR